MISFSSFTYGSTPPDEESMLEASSTLSSPAMTSSLPSSFASANVSHAASIARSMEAINSQFPVDKIGSLEVNTATGVVTFYYEAMGGGGMVQGTCTNGQCGSVAGSGVQC